MEAKYRKDNRPRGQLAFNCLKPQTDSTACTVSTFKVPELKSRLHNIGLGVDGTINSPRGAPARPCSVELAQDSWY